MAWPPSKLYIHDFSLDHYEDLLPDSDRRFYEAFESIGMEIVHTPLPSINHVFAAYPRDMFFFLPNGDVLYSESSPHSEHLDTFKEAMGLDDSSIKASKAKFEGGNIVYNHTTNQIYFGGSDSQFESYEELERNANILSEETGIEVVPVYFKHRSSTFYHLDGIMNVLPNGEILVYEDQILGETDLSYIKEKSLNPYNGWINISKEDAINYASTNFLAFGNNVFTPGFSNSQTNVDQDGNLINTEEILEQRDYNVVTSFEMYPELEHHERTHNSDDKVNMSRGVMLHYWDNAGPRCASNHRPMSCEEFVAYKYLEMTEIMNNQNLSLGDNIFFSEMKESAQSFSNEESENILDIVSFLADKAGFDNVSVDSKEGNISFVRGNNTSVVDLDNIKLVPEIEIKNQDEKNLVREIIQLVNHKGLYINHERESDPYRFSNAMDPNRYSEIGKIINSSLEVVLDDEEISQDETEQLELIYDSLLRYDVDIDIDELESSVGEVKLSQTLSTIYDNIKSIQR